jgi:hypothetical protein
MSLSFHNAPAEETTNSWAFLKPAGLSKACSAKTPAAIRIVKRILIATNRFPDHHSKPDAF